MPKKVDKHVYDHMVDREMVTEAIIYHDLPFRYDFFELEKSIEDGASDPKTHLDIYLEEPRLNRKANLNLDLFFALEIGCAVLLNTKVPLKIFLMKMKMLEKKQVVQEWSLQHQKNEVFDGIMEVWNKVNRPDVNGSGHKRAGQALINIPSHQSRCGCLPYLSSSP
ncbi:BnaC08g04800D [Brassica napus]|uniref:BnaC08g04800D protein n=1 Tax=Brassica napus TaxID=3708 RepID=A0A078HSX9_BRANA|nr:BnaC08g04800D [Brassica napus]